MPSWLPLDSMGEFTFSKLGLLLTPEGRDLMGGDLSLLWKVQPAFPPLPTPVRFGGCAPLCCVTRACWAEWGQLAGFHHVSSGEQNKTGAAGTSEWQYKVIRQQTVLNTWHVLEIRRSQGREWNLLNLKILSGTATGRELALGKDAWDVCAEKVCS